MATLLGVSEDGVALIPATSYGLAVAAQNLTAREGDQVVVWRGYRRTQQGRSPTGAELLCRRGGEGLTPAALRHIGERTRVVAVPNVQWTNGAILDLEAIARATKAVAAALVVDASQSLGALPLDISLVQPDFLVAVGYKWLLGPFGVSYLYMAEQYRDGQPLEENWINRAGSDDFAALVDYTDEYRAGARRFDVGARTNFGLVPMAIEAIDQLLTWGIAEVAASLRVVTDAVGQRAGELGFTVPPGAEHGPHLLGIEVPRDVALRMSATLKERRVIAGVRGSSLRVSPHLHVTGDDIDRLIDGARRSTGARGPATLAGPAGPMTAGDSAARYRPPTGRVLRSGRFGRPTTTKVRPCGDVQP